MSSGGSRVNRPTALIAGLILAVAATAVLVVTDDLALLRLAVVGALWAFLIAAFVAGARRPAPGPVSTEVALRHTHELELEREAALRREAELNAEIRVRRELDSALREDIAGLRGDLQRLRQDIADRWDGELRVERVAVRSESTRVSGFGASFHALQDEARRLAEQGGPLFEVEAGADGAAPRTILVPAADALPALPRSAADTVSTVSTVSTVEFSAVPKDETPEQERTGPVYGLPVPPLLADGSESDPEARPETDADPVAPTGRRSRHRGGAEAVGPERGEDAADLVRRLHAETTGEMVAITDQTVPPRRRRRARDDDETNAVLARVLGER